MRVLLGADKRKIDLSKAKDLNQFSWTSFVTDRASALTRSARNIIPETGIDTALQSAGFFRVSTVIQCFSLDPENGPTSVIL